MVEWLAWVSAALLGLFLLDRVLLLAEARGWIYYRKNKPGRGAATYHLLEMSTIFDPSMRPVQEIRIQEEESENEAGDPPVVNPED